MRKHGVNSKSYQKQLAVKARGVTANAPVRRPGTSLFALMAGAPAAKHMKAENLVSFSTSTMWVDEASKMPDLSAAAIKKMQESLHAMMSSTSYFVGTKFPVKLPGKSIGWDKSPFVKPVPDGGGDYFDLWEKHKGQS
jgi:hypothetical protein